MDEVTLESLEAALAATPHNTTLLLTVVRERLKRGEFEKAARLIPAELPMDGLLPGDRRVLGEALAKGGAPERALQIASGGSPGERLARAMALLALDRITEGREAYEGAIVESPLLADPELAKALGARERVTNDVGAGRPRYQVSARDEGLAEAELKPLFQPEAQKVTFADVGGLEPLKEQIRRRIILPFQKPSLFERFKRKSGGGILLFGPPGVGKTMLARATAGECQAKFFNVAISDVLDMYIGESEQKLHALFEKARAAKPAVLFFDEVEALGGKRQFARDGHTAKLVSQFLSEMDGFASQNTGVLILGATNTPWAVDAAFRRPGRFDRTFFVPPPDREAREAILALKLAGRPVAPGIELEWLAKSTSGFSGADLEHLIDTAADLAIEATIQAGKEVPIGAEQLKQAAAEVKPTTLEWLTTARNHARYANESGQYDEVLEFLAKHGKA